MKAHEKTTQSGTAVPELQLQKDYDTLAHEYRLLSAKYERLKATVLSISQEVKPQK